MEIQNRWFVLYQPKYRTPCVFDLHKRWLFGTKPFVTGNCGARLLINENLQVSIQYLYRYIFANRHRCLLTNAHSALTE